MSQHVEGHRKDKLKHVKLSEITVENRFRQDYGDMEEFVESIKAKGIIQPVTISADMRLLAGGRRYRGAEIAGLPTIPVIIRELDGDVDALEIELMENVYRKDFSWHEQAKLVEQIDKYYKENDPNKNSFGAWSNKKTANLLDRSSADVSRNLQLARYVDAVPELKECKTADEALKLIKNIEETAITQELRKRQDASVNTPNAVNNSMEKGLRDILKLADNNYQISDVFEGLKSMQDNGHIGVIECDPPYGIDLNAQKAGKDSSTSTVHGYKEITEEDYPEFLEKLCSELYRVAGRNSWMVFWYGWTWHPQVLATLRKAGWHVDEIPGIWVKNQGQTLQPEVYLARSHEPFFLCRKGKPVFADRGKLNSFSFPGVAGKAKYHPTQRPHELIQEILQTLIVGQQVVFVPFLGSGQTLLTCYSMGLHAFGFDADDRYKDKFMLQVERETKTLFNQDK